MENNSEKIFLTQLASAKGIAISPFAKLCGLSESTFNRRTKDRVEVNHQLSLGSLEKIAKYLGVPLYSLLEFRDKISKALAENKPIPEWIDPNIKNQYGNDLQSRVDESIKKNRYGIDDIDIVGRANGSSEATMLNFDEPIGKTRRIASQVGYEGARAMYVSGDSMWPRHKHGELVYFIIDKPAPKGEDCIVEMHNGESYVKYFIKWTEEELICGQYNPSGMEWKRPKKDVKGVYAVVR